MVLAVLIVEWWWFFYGLGVGGVVSWEEGSGVGDKDGIESGRDAVRIVGEV